MGQNVSLLQTLRQFFFRIIVLTSNIVLEPENQRYCKFKLLTTGLQSIFRRVQSRCLLLLAGVKN